LTPARTISAVSFALTWCVNVGKAALNMWAVTLPKSTWRYSTLPDQFEAEQMRHALSQWRP
jgi:hypothetical protein